jgi:hypothetical protein
MGLDEFMRDRLIEREETQEKTARCCQYGYFGDGHKCAKEQPVGDVVESPLRVRGGTLQDFKAACTAPISQESAKKMVQLAIAERDAQWEKAVHHQWPLHNHADAKLFVEYLRTEFAQADKPRTPAERVTIAQDHLGVWCVFLDGTCENIFCTRKGAERYAAGLRAELEKAQ